MNYVLIPGIRKYETRHEAVGAKATVGRFFPKKDYQVVPIEEDSLMDAVVDHLNWNLNGVNT